MSKLADRVDALERTGGCIPQAEIRNAMRMLGARAMAKLAGATELPPDPPAHVVAEIERLYCTPAAVEEARAKLERLLLP